MGSISSRKNMSWKMVLNMGSISIKNHERDLVVRVHIYQKHELEIWQSQMKKLEHMKDIITSNRRILQAAHPSRAVHIRGRDEVTVAMALSGPRTQRMMIMQMNSKGHARREGTTARAPNPEATHGGPQSAATAQQGCDTRKRSQQATVFFSWPCSWQAGAAHKAPGWQ